ncbi:MAG TPA: DUF5668 domain-containing protein [Candidatus Saccharimonadia bacterium]|jgi:predicted membrane protein|nr:DUF5668 domain-containing protein [Candidatus Saccharimonadia bacterium]
MKNQSSPQIFIGLVIVALGFGFLLNSLGILGFGSFIGAWWPVLIITLGALILINRPRQYLWPLFIIIAGVLFQLRTLGVVDFNVWNVLWPIAIIITGLSFLVSRSPFTGAQITGNPDVNQTAIFSGAKSKVQTKDFKGGQIMSLFGGVELDLRDSDIKGRASLDVTAIFGGAEIRVPEAWSVVTTGVPIFGGWKDKTVKPGKAGAPVLEIRGAAIFGGFEVKN